MEREYKGNPDNARPRRDSRPRLSSRAQLDGGKFDNNCYASLSRTAEAAVPTLSPDRLTATDTTVEYCVYSFLMATF